MAQRVLVVTKDIMEFRLYKPIVTLLKERGINVVIVAEGLSLAAWSDAGFSVWGGAPDAASMNASTLERYDINPKHALEEIAPDVVLTGLASPINLGDVFGLVANQMGISLGFVEDLWRTHTRSRAIPEFVCTLDPYGAQSVKQTYGDSSRVQIVATGSPAMDHLSKIRPDAEVQGIADNVGQVVLVAGQDHETTPLLEGLLKALENMGDYLLIPRIHPKLLALSSESLEQEANPQKRKELRGLMEACDLWRSMLSRAKNGYVLWVGRSDVSIQQLMVSSDVVVSVYSNALLEAACMRRIPVSWNSALGRESMAREMGGITQFPLVGYGAALEIESAEEYQVRMRDPGTHAFLHKQDGALKSDGKNAERVVDVISSYV